MVAGALIISLSIHEFAHAYTADRLGDNTPRLLGRVTLNPLAHLDPVGTLLILFAGFGWGRPVPFNPINLSDPKKHSALIAFAGPLSNFIMASVLALIFHLLPLNSLVSNFLYLTIFYNVALGVFNLIPIAPLDGSKVVEGFLPPSLHIQWLQIQRYGIFLLMILIFTDGTNVVVMPLVKFITSLLGLGV